MVVASMTTGPVVLENGVKPQCFANRDTKKAQLFDPGGAKSPREKPAPQTLKNSGLAFTSLAARCFAHMAPNLCVLRARHLPLTFAYHPQ